MAVNSQDVEPLEISMVKTSRKLTGSGSAVRSVNSNTANWLVPAATVGKVAKTLVPFWLISKVRFVEPSEAWMATTHTLTVPERTAGRTGPMSVPSAPELITKPMMGLMVVTSGVWFSGDASHRLFGSPSGSAPEMASPPAPQTASIAARAEARPMNAPADQSPPRIRPDAAALPTADLPPPQSSDIADSAPPRSEQLEAPATRKAAARSRRKAPRVARQGRDDRGPAMVLMESGRPPRGAAAGPGWGGWYPGQNVWR